MKILTTPKNLWRLAAVLITFSGLNAPLFAQLTGGNITGTATIVIRNKATGVENPNSEQWSQACPSNPREMQLALTFIFETVWI
jgi:hypothetical protein